MHQQGHNYGKGQGWGRGLTPRCVGSLHLQLAKVRTQQSQRHTPAVLTPWKGLQSSVTKRLFQEEKKAIRDVFSFLSYACFKYLLQVSDTSTVAGSEMIQRGTQYQY